MYHTIKMNTSRLFLTNKSLNQIITDFEHFFFVFVLIGLCVVLFVKK